VPKPLLCCLISKRGIMRSDPYADPISSDSSTAAEALARAADRLDLSNKTVARIIGVSEPTICRMRKGDYVLNGKLLELAIMFHPSLPIARCDRKRRRFGRKSMAATREFDA
jgi:hypothetical protein